MIPFKSFHKAEVVQDVIDELEKLKIHHNFAHPVSEDMLRFLAQQLKDIGIEPEDIYASIEAAPEKQEEYLFYKSAPGSGMGKGALGDLKTILSQER